MNSIRNVCINSNYYTTLDSIKFNFTKTLIIRFKRIKTIKYDLNIQYSNFFIILGISTNFFYTSYMLYM